MGQRSPTPAKITAPRLTAACPRERLYDALDRMGHVPAVWVGGPPGSGKTTLIVGYLEGRQSNALWYQVDSGDSDVATFFYYLGMAAQKAAPRKKKLPLFTPEYAPGVSAFARNFFEAFFNRLQNPAALVLDNCQEVSPTSPFHEVVREMLSVIPEGIQVFLLSRTDPPPALARARANGQLEILGWPELRLKVEETRGLVRFFSRGEHTDEVIETFHQKTDGWLAGLLLLLKRSPEKNPAPDYIAQSTPQAVFDYFAGEILERVAPETRAVLLETAVFPWMTVPMAKTLTGTGRAGVILPNLVRRHDFTDLRPGKDPAYQYHPLFREFLMGKAKTDLDPPRLAGIKKRRPNCWNRPGRWKRLFPCIRNQETPKIWFG